MARPSPPQPSGAIPHPLEHAPAPGLAARLDPRGKVVVALAYSSLIALCPGPQAPAQGLGRGQGQAGW
ncbi:MAG: hypothetical protein AB1814_06010 [Thermodesulfobacteriota bacterium]